MKLTIATGLLVGMSLFRAVAGPDPIYINTGFVTETPDIDATIFVNTGTFDVSGGFGGTSFGGFAFFFGGSIPYSPQNTLFYTNSGAMSSSQGFQLDFASPTGRRSADTVVNRGTIEGGIGLYIDATNVHHSGTFGASPDGIVRIEGKNINLTRGAIRVGTSPDATTGGRGFVNEDDSTYSNPNQVADLFWGTGENGVLNTGGTTPTQGQAPLNLSLLQMPAPRSPSHQVVNTAGRTNRVSVPVAAGARFAAFANTNKINDSNFLVQAVFVRTNTISEDVNFKTDVRFAPSTLLSASQQGRMAMVELSLWDIDVVSGFPFTNRLYLLDHSGATTNLILSTNSVFTNYARPLPYEVVYLTTPREWGTGRAGNTAYTNTLINGPYAQSAVTNFYLSYAAEFGPDAITDFFAVDPSTVDPTNKPGRLEIIADTLDIKELRVRSEGMTSIKANHYNGSSPRRIDSPLINFDLGGDDKGLTVSNTVPESVRRFAGQLYAWTGVFTNNIFVEVPAEDPAQPPTTNQIDFTFSVLIVDHNIQSIRPVEIRDFIMRSSNAVEVADRIAVSRALSVEGKSFLNRGQVLLSDQLPNLVGTNFSGVVNFTNFGVISVPSTANFGNDRAQPFENLINKGTVQAGAVYMAASNLDNGGVTVSSVGEVGLKADALKLDDARTVANRDLLLSAREIKGRRATLTAGTIITNSGRPPTYISGTLHVDARELLTDGGPGASNRWTVTDGFRFLSKPVSGDILGTRLTSYTRPFGEATHLWPGEDRGLTVDGFTNNLAVGRLVLDGAVGSLFSFSGTGSSNALYVDFLELINAATNVADSISLSPNMVIYFAAANVPVETLDGKQGGRLRWMRSFAGPNSSTNILVNGKVVSVNRSLLTSSTIDSDGDGVVNRADASPFDGARITSLAVANDPLAAVISWNAAAQTAYRVEYLPEVGATNWVLLGTVSNSSTNTATLRFSDPIAPEAGARYYRVVYQP